MINDHIETLYIGTSGIAIPGNKKSFPEFFHNKSRLNYYSTHFNSIEINSSFYKVPLRATFQKWACDVPENFRFTIKLWKEITHVKDLAIDYKNIDKFCNAAGALNLKKGCLLLQFPGKISLANFNEVEAILKYLDEQVDQLKWRTAVEFRNDEWNIGETKELLQQYNTTLVMHDFKKGKPGDSPSKENTVYLRFHGPAGDYKGSYSDEILKIQSLKIKEWLYNSKDVFVYFNNTMGMAWQNALTLKNLVEL